MRYLFLGENVLFIVNIRFHCPEPHWTPSDVDTKYLTIIPQARMGSESIGHWAKAEWAIDSETMRVI